MWVYRALTLEIQNIWSPELLGISAVVMILIRPLLPIEVRQGEVIGSFSISLIVKYILPKIGEGLEKEGKF